MEPGVFAEMLSLLDAVKSGAIAPQAIHEGDTAEYGNGHLACTLTMKPNWDK